jgi:hypothetical protein
VDCRGGWDDDCDGLLDCADPDCAGRAPCEADEATCDDDLDNDGDGRRDCADLDCLDVVAERCDNGRDDDCDGRVDCADPDCRDTPVCQDGGWCAPARLLGLGEVVTGSTVGAPARLGAYACNPYPETGPEQFFRFVAPASQEVTVVLTLPGADLDVVVLGAGPGGGCDLDNACLGSGVGTLAEERVTFPTTAGETYFIVVDGYDEAAADFTLELRLSACASTETWCADGADDDCDGLVDCADPDCHGLSPCEAVEAACGDGLDNDGDGLVDCDDPDCASALAESCADDLDNDCDGLVDCADPDCAGLWPCEAVEVTCDDGRDNDGDGLTDCAEPTCAGLTYCRDGGACQPWTAIACGDSLAGSNVGERARLSWYPCSPYEESGAEALYRLVPGTSGEVTVSLSGLQADLDLLILGTGPSGACDPEGRCLAASVTAGAETVTFSAIAGAPYFLVVDGYEGAESGFRLDVACQ